MSNLLVVGLIAKAAYDSQHRSSSKSSINSNNNKHYNSSSSYTYKLIDSLEPRVSDGSAPGRLSNCVNSIIENTPEIMESLAPYIEALEKEQKQRDLELDAELETYCEPSAKIVDEYKSSFEALSETGFDARYLINPPENPYGPDPEIRYEEFLYVRPNPNGPHASYHVLPKDISLDGVQIKRSDIEAGINPFEKELNEYLKKHPTYQQDLEKLTAAATSLENKKLALFLSSRKKEELASLKAKLQEVKAIYNHIEKFCKFAIPALVVCMIIVIIRAVTLPGAMDGLAFIFKPSLEPFKGTGWIGVLGAAGNQCFFSLSLASGCLIAYGAGLSKSENLEKNAMIVAVADTCVAVMAGVLSSLLYSHTA